MRKSKKRKPRKAKTESQFDAEKSVEALAKKAIKYGYWSIVLGILSAPVAFYFAIRAARAIDETGAGKKFKPRLREARRMALFGCLVWSLVLFIQCGGGNG